MNLGEMPAPVLPDKSKWDLADRWILSRLNATVKQVNEQFDKFEFGEAGRALYNFIWNDFCDWYIEMTKEKLNNGTDEEKQDTKNILGYVLDQTLKLMHPIMPFVTEKLWQSMPHDGKSIMVADYPVAHDELDDADATDQMSNLIEMIKAVRNIRNEANAPMSKPVDILVKVDNQHLGDMLNANRDYIDRFCHPAELTISTDVKAPKLAMTGILAGAEVYIPMAELVDLDEERAKMQKEIAKLEKEVQRSQKKLGNEKFVANAPEKVVEAEKQKAVEWQQKLDSAKERLASLQEA
jgi:valyl-tRNA synthetase